ncbi:D-amino acid aminotransferase [Limnochorda pilosa]|uniref:D-amino acid aminotransferase n=1 Tax=Limnochorda pilosa TaxID=1555112 RepID=UPI00082E00C1|nr:D-amino acid aminotransferase [Limnochorda pilosa]
MGEWVYLNGEFKPYDEACLSVEDRGFLFADGIYEVIYVHRGRAFRMEDHLARLQRSAAAVRLELPRPAADLEAAAGALTARNGLEAEEATVYLELTRGSAPRQHAFPAQPRPTLLMIARKAHRPEPEKLERGVSVITVPDERWHWCHVKSVGLLPNVLAKQQAVESGAFEAVFVRDGRVTEGSSTNLFAVFDGVLWTHPADRWILGGVTRSVVLELAGRLEITVREEAVEASRLGRADELFLTGTTTTVLPVVRVDGRAVGSGEPGPLTRRLQEAYLQELEA